MKTPRVDLRSLLVDDELLSRILQYIRGNSVEVYLVGGYIRDKILGRARKDVDLVVAGDIEKYGRELADTLGGSFFLLGDKEVARIAVENKGLRKIDVCPLQGRIEDNLKLRDFTVNSLAVDAKELAKRTVSVPIMDVTGGLRDLKDKKISAISSEIFKKDPLRVIRAVRFSVELGFDIEFKTVSCLKKSARLINDVSVERCQQELFLIFSLPDSYRAIELLDELGVIELILPEVKEIKGVTQNDYHHLDVWNHTLLALKNLEMILANLKETFPDEGEQIFKHLNQSFQGEFTRIVPLKFAALLHDVGKPRTRSVDSTGMAQPCTRVHFYHHSEVGSKMAKEICRRLKISKDGAKIVSKLTAEHMKVGYLSKEERLTDKAIRRFLKDCGDETIEILLLSLADRRATLGSLSTMESLNRHENFIKKVMKIYLSVVENPQPPLVTGYDLTKGLNLEPGELIGELLEEIKEARAEGIVSTKKEALGFAEKYLEDYSKENK